MAGGSSGSAAGSSLAPSLTNAESGFAPQVEGTYLLGASGQAVSVKPDMPLSITDTPSGSIRGAVARFFVSGVDATDGNETLLIGAQGGAATAGSNIDVQANHHLAEINGPLVEVNSVTAGYDAGLDFDGVNQYMEVASDAALAIATDRAFMCRVNLNTLATVQEIFCIGRSDQSSGNFLNYELAIVGGALRLTVGNGSTIQSVSVATTTGEHTIIGIVDITNSLLRLIVDGSETSAALSITPYTTAPMQARFGYWSGTGATLPFDGQFYDALALNRLPTTQEKTDYTDGTLDASSFGTHTLNDAEAYWPFGDGPGGSTVPQILLADAGVAEGSSIIASYLSDDSGTLTAHRTKLATVSNGDDVRVGIEFTLGSANSNHAGYRDAIAKLIFGNSETSLGTVLVSTSETLWEDFGLPAGTPAAALTSVPRWTAS